jgi:hypothetical protein
VVFGAEDGFFDGSRIFGFSRKSSAIFGISFYSKKLQESQGISRISSKSPTPIKQPKETPSLPKKKQQFSTSNITFYITNQHTRKNHRFLCFTFQV